MAPLWSQVKAVGLTKSFIVLAANFFVNGWFLELWCAMHILATI